MDVTSRALTPNAYLPPVGMRGVRTIARRRAMLDTAPVGALMILSCGKKNAAQRAELQSERMLVTFRTKAYANITMFGDVAKQLLQLMGHSGTIPSAIKAEDVPAALARLEAAIEQRKSAEAVDTPERERDRDDYDAPRRVALSTRAVPLLELLRAAAANRADVMWDS
jgi:hypothetical protein